MEQAPNLEKLRFYERRRWDEFSKTMEDTVYEAVYEEYYGHNGYYDYEEYEYE